MVFSGSNLQRNTNSIYSLFLKSFSNYWKKHLSLFSENSVVLIVDNDADNLLLATQVVKLLGYCVITARDGKSALRMIEKYQPMLVLLEIMLPEIDGINVTRHLRENNNFVPVIAVTSLPGDIFRDEALMAGCNKYVEKPFLIDDLETAINQVIYSPASIFNYVNG
ncbi:MAG: response regulator [Rivularia sp. T60_A2020_040]|nr:response regulator [Rivularia sp. T60_A2020_040]